LSRKKRREWDSNPRYAI